MTASVAPFDKIVFDFSLAEAVALQNDFVRATREGQSWRKREQRNFVLAVIGVAVVVGFLNIRRWDPVLLTGSAALATVIGLVLAIPFGWYYDRVVQKRTGRLLAERMGPGPYHCSIEIHPDALHVAQSGMGFVFPWASAVAVEDIPDGILIVFTTGRVLARTRGFTSAEHRRSFLARVREFVSGNGARM